MDPSQVNSFFETKIKNRFGFGLKKEQCKLISQISNGKNSIGCIKTCYCVDIHLFFAHDTSSLDVVQISFLYLIYHQES
jgi:hypothetical protein